MKLARGHTGRNESIRGLIVEKCGDQSARMRDTPQAIKPHRFDGLTDGEGPPCRVLFGRLGENLANAEFIAHASDQAEVV